MLLSSGANVNAETNNGITPLRIAVQRKNLQMVEHLLKHGAQVNSVNTSISRGEGYSPLHDAVEIGAKSIIELLLSRGADVDAKAKDGTTSLHHATRYEHLEIVELLLKRGASVNSVYTSTNDESYTSLHLAVHNGNEEITELLLSNCANVNAEGIDGTTALHIATEFENSRMVKLLLEHGNTDANNCMYAAVRNGFVEIVEEILKHGADVNMSYESMSGKRCIPLPLAVKLGKDEVAELLISYGADVNAPDETGTTPICYAIASDNLKMSKLLLTNNANIKDNPELLNIAVEHNRREIVELLLQHGADVNAVDESGKMPLAFIVASGELRYLYYSCTNHNSKGELAKLLLSRGANANAVVENSMTVLHAAADNRYEAVVEALLEYNADVNSTDEGGMTPLHLSAQRGNKVITEMLLNKGADINAKDDNGTTALHFATQRGYEEIVEVLLKRGAQVNATMKCDVITPLHLAAESGYLKIAKLLLKFSGRVDTAHNCHVVTPLHKAALNGDTEIIELLLKFGAGVDSTDEHGTTALHIASQRGHEDVVIALLEHGSNITMKNKAHRTALSIVMHGIESNRNYDYDRDFNFDFDEDYITCTYITIARILKRHVIKMRAANLCTYNKDDGSDHNELNDSEDDYYEEMYCSYTRIDRKKCRLSRNNFRSECEEEIENMKIEKVTTNTNITFYDILTKDVSRLAMYARSDSIVEALGSGDYNEKFPIYASIINNNFRKGEKRKEFLKQGNKILDLSNFKKLPCDCTERILSYLNNEDIRVLTDAGKPTAHCQRS